MSLCPSCDRTMYCCLPFDCVIVLTSIHKPHFFNNRRRYLCREGGSRILPEVVVKSFDTPFTWRKALLKEHYMTSSIRRPSYSVSWWQWILSVALRLITLSLMKCKKKKILKNMLLASNSKSISSAEMSITFQALYYFYRNRYDITFKGTAA